MMEGMFPGGGGGRIVPQLFLVLIKEVHSAFEAEFQKNTLYHTTKSAFKCMVYFVCPSPAFFKKKE